MPARAACAARLDEARLEVELRAFPETRAQRTGRHAAAGTSLTAQHSTAQAQEGKGRGEGKGQLQVREGAPPGGQVARARDPLLVFGECLPALAAPLLKPRGADAGGRSGLFSLSCKAASVVYTTWDPHTQQTRKRSQNTSTENCHSLLFAYPQTCCLPSVVWLVWTCGSIGIIMMAISQQISLRL